MKLLLTGEPRSGKTTLLERFVEDVADKQGFVTREVLENGVRVGFELVSSLGQTAPLASVNSNSSVRVSRYGVDIEQLDAFLIELPPVEKGKLLYVDEIGQMKLFSDAFKALINDYLNSNNSYVGTITSVYEDDFTRQILGREDVILFKVEQDNREQIRGALNGLAANVALLQKLNPVVQNGFTEMARKYAATSSFIQLKKLFNNAIKYLAEDRVEKTSTNTFKVKGNTNEHNVKREVDWVCDCDLFKGNGNYIGNAGECSHIQSAKLKNLEVTE